MALPSNLDWASLPINLLDSILDYLVPMEDYLTFSEVCVEWQYAVREKLQHSRSNHKRHCRLHQQVPLLMARSTDYPRNRCFLYDVMKGKSLCEFKLGGWGCEGSSHEWLILDDNADSYKVTLFNPFSGKFIHLPTLQKSLVIELFFPYEPRKGVLSTDPDVNSYEFVLITTCLGFEKRIAFIKSGEEDWTYVEELRFIEDIVYSNGLFYLLDGWGGLFSCDVSNDFKVRRITSRGNERTVVSYLVESPEGDLLRVIKHEEGFVVYKLVWFSRNPRWEEVMSLGDVALFLGNSYSTSIRASDFAGCRSNSIYFCQRCRDGNSFDGSVYVFSLNNGTVTALHPRYRRPLFWTSLKYPHSPQPLLRMPPRFT